MEKSEDKSKVSFVRKFTYFAAIALGLIFFDLSMVYLSLPSISLQFQSTIEMKWMVLSYFLPIIGMAGVIEPLLRRWGIRKMSLLGISVFTIGSALSATALLYWQLVIYRFIQGLGGAFLVFSVLRILWTYVKEEKGFIIPISLLGFIGGICGLIMGGVLLENGHWHRLFLIQILLGLLLYYLCLWILPREEPLQESVFRMGNSAIWLFSSLILIAVGFSPEAQVGGISTILWLVIGLGAFLLWIIKSKQNSKQRDFLHSKEKTWFSSIISLHIFLGSSLVFIIPFFFQKELGMSFIQTGFMLLMSFLLFLITSLIRERWFDCFMVYPQLGISLLVILVGLILLFTPHRIQSFVTLGTGLLGVGFGFVPVRFYWRLFMHRDFQACITIATIFIMSGYMGPIMSTLIWTPNMKETLPNRMDLQIVLYMLIMVVVLAMGLLISARFKVLKRGTDQQS